MSHYLKPIFKSVIFSVGTLLFLIAAVPLYAASYVEQSHLSENLANIGHSFGRSVALHQGTLAIGVAGYPAAWQEAIRRGAVYIYELEGGYSWQLKHELGVKDGEAYDHLGTSVALVGNTLVAGAADADISEKEDQGAVYVFEKIGEQWIQQQKLIAPDGEAGDKFGKHIAFDGKTIVVAAATKTVDDEEYQGVAYIFENVDGKWKQVQRLKGSDSDNYDWFGSSVALQDDTLVIGAYRPAKAYVFNRGPTEWKETDILTATDLKVGFGWFGYAVNINGNRIVVGAPKASSEGTMIEKGAAYVFIKKNGEWAGEKLLVDKLQKGDMFGSSVAIKNDVIAVGAVPTDISSESPPGKVYLFEFENGEWNDGKRVKGVDSDYDHFGASLALDEMHLVAGAPHFGEHVKQMGQVKTFAVPRLFVETVRDYIYENGTAMPLNMRLNVIPSANIMIEASGDSQLSVEPSNQMIVAEKPLYQAGAKVSFEMKGIDDADYEGEHSGRISFVVTSDDPRIDGMVMDPFELNIIDDEADPNASGETGSSGSGTYGGWGGGSSASSSGSCSLRR